MSDGSLPGFSRPCLLGTAAPYVLAIVLLGLAAPASHAQDEPAEGETAAPAEPLTVATRHVPPFAIKGEDGTWSGVTIDLWRIIADEQQLEFVMQEMELSRMLDGLSDGSVDVAAAALTVTAEREQRIDFTHPYYSTGLGIAVQSQGTSRWLAVGRRLLSVEFLGVVTGLALVLLAAGALLWFAERKRNADQFGGGVVKGLGNAFWWSAVTMTTVGYGDKAPVTFAGRAVALVWMFTAVVIISTFTAAIASSLTVSSMDTGIRGPQDLPEVRVGVVGGSTSEQYMVQNHIRYDTYETTAAGLDALAAGDIDAMVYDAPILQYMVNNEYRDLTVLGQTFTRQDYAIGLPEASPLREPVNQSLVETVRSPQWRDIVYRYLGTAE